MQRHRQGFPADAYPVEQMKPTEEPTDYIQSIGAAAHALLKSQLRGKVLAVVSQAAYLLTDQGELLWLATRNVPLHRRCIRVSGSLPGLTVDSAFHATDHCLIFSPGIRLDFSRVSIWGTSRFNPEEALPLADLPKRLMLFMFLLQGLPAPGGYGNLIPEIMQFTSSVPIHRSYQNLPVAVEYSRSVVEGTARACLDHDMQSILRRSGELVGLGEGLTPSGDDFVGGLLFCRMILQNTYGGELNLEPTDLSKFIENMKLRTNLISHALLRDHAEGYGMDILHHFMTAFLTGRSIENTRQVAAQLVRVGHSTGWDLLTGILAGMLLIVRNNRISIH